MGEYYVNGQLFHHGVKGQKWGVRRYRNEDGTLTAAGKKHYGKMSDDKLQKTLYKQVKDARQEQHNGNWASRFGVSTTIGKNSKEAQDKYLRDNDEYVRSEKYQSAVKRAKALDRKFDRGEIDPDEYDAQYEALRKSIYRPDLDRSVRIGNKGREYAKEYLDKYGKDLNVAYLKDLGYDEATARDFTERVLKANKKLLNGM